MIRVALVEDDAAYMAQLQEYLQRYAEASGEKFSVATFMDGDEIAIGYKAVYDIILMDIEMQFMDGMSAAEAIRQVDSGVVIIFITNAPQYAIKGYAVDALDYVLKPISYYAFSQRIDRALTRMKKRTQKFITINVKGGSQRLDVSRIYYVEVWEHSLVFHTTGGDYVATGSMREVESSIGSSMFFRCNKSYLVNLEQVEGVRGDTAQVGGGAVPISRARKKAFMDALNNYMSEVAK